MKIRIVLIFCLLIAFGIPVLAGDDLPAWLRDAAANKSGPFDSKAKAVVLTDQSTVTVGDDGRITTVSLHAVMVLQREGRDAAVAELPYETDIDKVKDFKAWTIRPGGAVKKYGKDDTVDLAVVDNDIYSEARQKRISGRDDAESGAIFGYQSTVESSVFFNQSMWYFQDEYPIVTSRLTLNIPTSWTATSVTLNHEDIKPTVNGSSYSWEVHNLPGIEVEPSMPGISSVVARLAVNYAPPVGSQGPQNTSYKTWNDVSMWYTNLSEPQVTLNDDLALKAREITANAKTEFEKIQAVGKYVQKINYIAVQIGVGRFRPHSAIDVFAKSYGDCKDKANLMRAMLKALHITAYPVLIFAGDPNFVRQEWVSPGQFNHCIVAVKVSDETQSATVINLPGVGRLMIFDATDPVTPLGDLPYHEQGSWAVIAAGAQGTLVRMPVTPPESNRLDRRSEVSLQSDGSINATVTENSVGQAAVRERNLLEGMSKPQYTRMIEGWISHGATGAKVSNFEPTESPDGGKFKLNVAFSADGYAQVMQGKLMVFKPAIISRLESMAFVDPKRQYPIELRSMAVNDTVTIKLPQGFDVDELPDGLKLDTAFGSYRASFEVKDGQLVFTRSVVQKAGIIPADQYDSVRKFYGRILAEEQAPVVLARK